MIKLNDVSRPSSDIARLSGCRLVVAPEPPGSMLFNVAPLKLLTGCDMINKRFLNGAEIQVRLQIKPIMTVNNTPKATDLTLLRFHVPINSRENAII